MAKPSHYGQLSVTIANAGFVMRGGFHCQANDESLAGVDELPQIAPMHSHGEAKLSLVLLGNAGLQGFAAFRHSPEWDTAPNPLERFTERVVGALAKKVHARALYPHQGPPWLPFQTWAVRAQALSPSPLGILIDAHYGLWHAYRAALLFDYPLEGLPVTETSARSAVSNICVSCESRACLSTCPVAAYDNDGFHLHKCETHLQSEQGYLCREQGCVARKACPVAVQHRYGLEQQRFHMQAFLHRKDV